MALAFLPTDQVATKFHQLVAADETQQLLLTYPNYEPFYRYVWENYVGPQAQFQIGNKVGMLCA